MISIKQALEIKDSHKIYDFCGRNLEVNNYKVSYEKGIPICVEFSCRDIYTNENLIYSYDEIYTDFEDLSDEDKLFLRWLRQDNECYMKCEDDIKSLRDAFMNGFIKGLFYKQKIKAEEQLQK